MTDQKPTLLIDNFDSFTWNLYQYLSILGANVTVVRNDELTEKDFPQLDIGSLIISPGPGHPQTDSGISRQAIRYFSGKVPILGVCMGLECVVDEFGGEIAYAGEIMHGKTSRVRHDGKGVFKGIPQGIPSTRYHSLSASISTLPDCLMITATTEESGVIMAIRHREYAIEAVQYHPESIMSDNGSDILKNFLQLRGGTWAANPNFQVSSDKASSHLTNSLPQSSEKRTSTILERIHAQRIRDIEVAKATPGTTPSDLSTMLSLHLAPPLIPVLSRLRRQPLSLMAEFKRASPSKGAIALSVSPAQQALKYALGGAAVISVLTEPTWFKGSLLDMRLVRQVVEHLPNRPAILRKDFIIDEYQILEARLHGADTILLIVAILPLQRLQMLYQFSVDLGMEPLVEVNNAEEMATALSINAKLIGVNNRNLHDFQVDMSTTTRLSDMCRGRDVTLCALSGISSREDVQKFVAGGVGAVLVGESLMRAPDPSLFIQQLLDQPALAPQSIDGLTLVKICGIRDKATALVAVEAGADMIGLVFAPQSKRSISIETAKEVVHTLREFRRGKPSIDQSSAGDFDGQSWFALKSSSFPPPSSRPLVVGVFQGQSLKEIIDITVSVQLDMVQLHGEVPLNWSHYIPVPTIKAFHLPVKSQNSNHEAYLPRQQHSALSSIRHPGYHSFILLDSSVPGSGITANWEIAKQIIDEGEIDTGDLPKSRLPIILAGGLSVANVREAVEGLRPWAVDVSSGVENEPGIKDHEKIRSFIETVKAPTAKG
ncbi:bifunctional tryptophan synthase trp1 [Tulasnella sp. 419]|nr:bifunctional tryptophan synthase trp1 [Tulasnella sp. 418]KAG8965283.1 bifunctional tryptophan synthase trp1 [Tulasnella sp. 419]